MLMFLRYNDIRFKKIYFLLILFRIVLIARNYYSVSFKITRYSKYGLYRFHDLFAHVKRIFRHSLWFSQKFSFSQFLVMYVSYICESIQTRGVVTNHVMNFWRGSSFGLWVSTQNNSVSMEKKKIGETRTPLLSWTPHHHKSNSH